MSEQDSPATFLIDPGMTQQPTDGSLPVSVIISTYNSPAHLEKCLTGFLAQDWPDFEILVADDGSTGETRELVESISRHAPFPVLHFWQPDEGFRKPAILNKAIKSAQTEYLLFTDGDCIPRKDFVRVHATGATVDRFLSAGVEYLSATATTELPLEAILDQSLFDPRWIRNHRERPRRFGKVNHNPVVQLLAKWTSFTRPTFNGHNVSAWKSDILAANGFDERMKYGGLDRELGERLVTRGLRG
ncbi:MAG: glycosyltransferase, partial [Verrucomicrobiales bacterium]